MDDLEEMDRFLAKVNFTRLNQEEREMMNKPITSTYIKPVIKKKKQKQKNKKKSPKNKSPGPDCFTGEFYQTVREELSPILLQLFQKTAEEGTV